MEPGLRRQPPRPAADGDHLEAGAETLKDRILQTMTAQGSATIESLVSALRMDLPMIRLAMQELREEGVIRVATDPRDARDYSEDQTPFEVVNFL